MRLDEYIRAMGAEKCAALWKVKPRTVLSWMYGDRTPRPKQADLIVQTSPVTYEGIHLCRRKEAA